MKTCPKCMSQFTDEKTVCPNCGEPLGETENMSRKFFAEYEEESKSGLASFFNAWGALGLIVGSIAALFLLDAGDEFYAIVLLLAIVIESFLSFGFAAIIKYLKKQVVLQEKILKHLIDR